MSTRGRAEFVDASGGLVAVSNLDGIVELFYLNGTDLSPAGSIEPGFHPVAVKIIGDYLYVGGLEVSLRIYDISNPRFPLELYEVNFEGYPHDYIVRNDTMFVAAYHGGVVLLDINNPARPLLLQQYNLGSYDLRSQLGAYHFGSDIAKYAAGYRLQRSIRFGPESDYDRRGPVSP
jgi:hypothetical protein